MIGAARNITPKGWQMPTPREQRAGRVAASQGLVLQKSPIQCGRDYACRYDLLYTRYEQPAALSMKLPAVEVWLGIRGTRPR
ncbi:MAG TPA: hypothetical protein VLD39_00250 [Gammaproteobacteria bacterium]|nr:hypothetical protein [Gammaproteobacteria bacterium]